MRANVPRQQNTRPSFELEGRYLQAMQTISVSLMEVLPDGERLWELLGKTEALLMEAQMTATPIEELFPNGGVAGFCQSVIDEYKAEMGADTVGKKPPVPASRDKRSDAGKSKKKPRGGEGALRYRRVSKLLTVLAVLVLAAVLVWQSGFYRFVTMGSAFYHEELHNFENTVIEPCGEELRFTVTPTTLTGLEQVIYTDAEGYVIKLSAVDSRERTAIVINEDGKRVAMTVVDWYVTLRYTVNAGFSHICTVSPEARGTARLTLADGTVYESTLTSDSSGPLSRGWEYAQFTVMDGIPKSVNLSGAVLTVTVEPPVYRVWERIGIGKR
jgi:hypothetical protein